MRGSYQPRAQQFSPYAALRGLDEVVAEKRRITEGRRELCEDEAEELSRKLADLSCGNRVTVCFYFTDCYVKKSGIVKDLDSVFRRLVLVDNTQIAFDDILSLELKGDF